MLHLSCISPSVSCKDKSTLQIFKIFQCIGESGPQSVLLTSIQMKKPSQLRSAWSYLMKDFNHSPWTSTLITITLSLLSLVFTSGSLMVESGFVIKGIMMTPYHSFSQNLIHTTLMVLVQLVKDENRRFIIMWAWLYDR